MNKKIRIALLILAAIVILAFVYFANSGKRTPKMHNYGAGPYSDHQISMLYQDAFTPGITIDQLESACDVRYLDKDADTKTVIVPGDSQVLILNYDEDGTLQSGSVHTMSRESADFDRISEGESIRTVMEIDPDGDYSYLFSGRNDIPKVSYHYTPDGYCIQITYDSNNEILEMVKTMLEE